MTMFTAKGMAASSKKAAAQGVSIAPEVQELVTFFYPDQLPQVALLPSQVANIMNCDPSKAIGICKKVERQSGRKMGVTGIFLIDFCACMEVDDLLIQLFLASIRHANAMQRPGSVSPKKKKASESGRMKVATIIAHLKDHAPDGVDIVKHQAALWKQLYPLGEPMGKRKDKYRMLIYTDEVAQIFDCHLRTAQKMFQTIRDAEGLSRSTRITVKKFCHFFQYDEADVRKALAVMYGEDEPEA